MCLDTCVLGHSCAWTLVFLDTRVLGHSCVGNDLIVCYQCQVDRMKVYWHRLDRNSHYSNTKQTSFQPLMSVSRGGFRSLIQPSHVVKYFMRVVTTLYKFIYLSLCVWTHKHTCVYNIYIYTYIYIYIYIYTYIYTYIHM